MTFGELKKESSFFFPAVVIERLVGRRTIKRLLSALGVVSVILAVAVIFLKAGGLAEKFLPAITELFGGGLASGLFLIVFGLWLAVLMVESFYMSYACRGLETILPEKNLLPRPGITFPAASVIIGGVADDAAMSLIKSPFGPILFSRLGIAPAELVDFLKKRLGRPAELSLKKTPDNGRISLSDLAGEVFLADKEFSIFLASRGVTAEDFRGVAIWVERMVLENLQYGRFWGKDKLGRIPGIGKDWAYGEANILKKHSTPIEKHPAFAGFGAVESAVRETLETETILSKIRGANAVIVAESDDDAMDVVAGLGRKIADGSVMPPLEHKRIFVLDHTALIAATKEKNLFETETIRMLNEAVSVGDVILVIPNLPGFIENASGIGADLTDLLSSYILSPAIHIVATSSVQAFHARIEPDQRLMKNFEKVLVKAGRGESVMPILMMEALAIESASGVFFTFQALRAAAESAERYFSGSSPVAQAVDLLMEAAASTRQIRGQSPSLIGRADILALVKTKTGVPAGEMGEDERKKISNLEDVLKKRIVGQDEAVKAVAGAMRRARSGVGNPNRPIGSFLFLGPTGVGKTETTKALAAAFFGNEETIVRLDMSEYRTADALERLIGSWSGGKAGVLSSALRDRPYGVLLLDEFEKTNKEVLDLFLQVFDEGFFSDMSGKKVSARNLIIIATSNAGSDLIWNTVREKGPTALNKDEVVGAVISQGIFKPELVNRFDGVIVFRPLAEEHLRKIAVLMLDKLAKRLSAKGLELVVTDRLIEALVSRGTDPKFGARPMNRAIQDKVEQLIADKIIKGEAPAGTAIQFTESEIASIGH